MGYEKRNISLEIALIYFWRTKPLLHLVLIPKLVSSILSRNWPKRHLEQWEGWFTPTSMLQQGLCDSQRKRAQFRADGSILHGADGRRKSRPFKAYSLQQSDGENKQSDCCGGERSCRGRELPVVQCHVKTLMQEIRVSQKHVLWVAETRGIRQSCDQ